MSKNVSLSRWNHNGRDECFGKRIRGMMAGMAAALFSLTICLPLSAASPEDWFDVGGTFRQTAGAELAAGTLQLLPLDNGTVLFEIGVPLDEGMEPEAVPTAFHLPGTIYIEENGTGTWEQDTEGGTVSLVFTLEGKRVSIEQSGTLPSPVAGVYTWQSTALNVTEECAGELLEGIATAATSLNESNRPYHLDMSNLVVDGWFYEMKAIHTPTDTVIGEFLIARDLSAVYRTDMEVPTLIHGSADSMLSAVQRVVLDATDMPAVPAGTEALPASSPADEGFGLELPLVDAIPSRTSLAVGKTGQVAVITPGNIPATVVYASGNPDILTVDETGMMTGIVPGKALLLGTISVDGSEKEFSFEVTVVPAAAPDAQVSTGAATPPDASAAATAPESTSAENSGNAQDVAIPATGESGLLLPFLLVGGLLLLGFLGIGWMNHIRKSRHS